MLADVLRPRVRARDLVQYSRNGLTVTRGPAREFPPEALCSIASKTHEAYLASGLFPCLPKEEEPLVAVSLSQGMEDRLIVSISKNDEIIGGCMVALGTQDAPLASLSGKPDSTLPTLWALSVPFTRSEEARNTPEHQTICFTRFWRDPQITDPTVRRLFAMETLSSMVLVTEEFLPETTFAIALLDTHDARVAKTLVRFYQGRFLARPGESRRTPQVAETILNRHYDPLESVIAVLWFKHQEILACARDVNRMLDVYEGHNGYHPIPV